MLRSTAITKELAVIERKLSETSNQVLKDALKKKQARLKDELNDAKKSTPQLAKKLLAQRAQIKALSKVDFNDLIRRLSKKPEYSFLKTMSKSTVKTDLERRAKPVGWRFKGRGNYDKPTMKEIVAGKRNKTVYREVRPRRSDVNLAVRLQNGGMIGDSGTITDSKSMYQGKMGFIEMDMGNEWIVKVLDNGKEKSVTVRKSGFKILKDDKMKNGGGVNSNKTITPNWREEDTGNKQVEDLKSEIVKIVKSNDFMNSKFVGHNSGLNEYANINVFGSWNDFDKGSYDDEKNVKRDWAKLKSINQKIKEVIKEHNLNVFKSKFPEWYKAASKYNLVDFNDDKKYMIDIETKYAGTSNYNDSQKEKEIIADITKAAPFKFKDAGGLRYSLLKLTFSKTRKMENGGVIGQEIVFDDSGEENKGVIKDIHEITGNYVVLTDDGRTVLADKELDVISLGKMRAKPAEAKKRFGFFEDGGNVAKETNEMLMSQIKEVKHHADELSQVVSKNTTIEPWVLAKATRAKTDLSDITHYLDGRKMKYGGKLNDAQQEKFNKVMREWKAGTLHSGKNGPVVKEQDQAIAIAYAQANSMMAFGGMINDDLSEAAIDRMEGLSPNATLDEFIMNSQYIVKSLEEEGFEKDEILSFLAHVMVTNISEAQSTSTQIINNADNGDNVNPPKPAILVELYNALSKAKNKKSLYWGYDEDEGWSVYFENGLESESDYHQGEMDSYQFFAMDNNKIQAVYTVNGYDKPNLTVSSALEWSRANEEQSSSQTWTQQDQDALEGWISDIQYGYGWITPGYVETSWTSRPGSGTKEWTSDIQRRVYQALIDENMLFRANENDPEKKGRKVKDLTTAIWAASEEMSNGGKMQTGGGVEDCTASYEMFVEFVESSNDEYMQDANIVPYMEMNGIVVSYKQGSKKVAVIVYNPRKEKLSRASVISKVMTMFPKEVQANIDDFSSKYSLENKNLCSATLIKIVNHNGELMEEFEEFKNGGAIDAMSTVNEIARLSGVRSIAVAEWGDRNNINLSMVLKDLKSKKIKGMDVMTAVVGKPGNKYSKELIAKYAKMSTGGAMSGWKHKAKC